MVLGQKHGTNYLPYTGVRRWIYIHSCYGVKGRYFTLLQVVTEGGDLL